MNEKLLSVDTPKNVMFVEGSDDSHVCFQLLRSYHMEKNVDIIDKKGINNLLQTLDVELLASEPRRIGIIVDADEDVSTRWQSLKNILISTGYQTVPSLPDLSGTILKEEDMPSIGIWIMPDNQVPGMLEHFCRFLIPSDDILWGIAEGVLQDVMQKDCRFPEIHKIKAHMHTWLAWQKEPGKPMGQAIAKRFFNPATSQAQLFISWAQKLFEIDPAFKA